MNDKPAIQPPRRTASRLRPAAGGRTFIGTNNARPFDPEYTGERGVLLCLNEADGKLLWQLVTWPGSYGSIGLCSPATVDGDRVCLAFYITSHRYLFAFRTEPEKKGAAK